MRTSLYIVFLVVMAQLASATHLRSGYISVQRLGPGSLTCRITITAYVSTQSPVAFGGGVLSFGDNTFEAEIPQVPSIARPDLGPGVGVATYTTEHTYAASGAYVISYSENSRNAGIINLENSIFTPFYVETIYYLDPFLGEFNTPEFIVEPFFIARLGSPVSLAVSAVNTEDHFVRYELSVPNLERGRPTSPYTLPENVSVNAFNGLFKWDGKFRGQYIPGEYLFTVRIHQYKTINGKTYRLSSSSYDLQLILVDEPVGGRLWTNTTLDSNKRLYIPSGESRTIRFFFEPNGEQTVLQTYAELINTNEAFSFTTYDSSDAPIKVGVLTLTSTPNINRENPYLIVIRGKQQSGASTLFTDDVILFYTRDVQPEIITGLVEEELQVDVYPNPVTDYLYIAMAGHQSVQIRLMNNSGVILLREVFTDSGYLDIRNLASGIYICLLRSGNQQRLVKIIKR